MQILVASHKGGVGKTTTTLTLAHLLNERGEDVSVLDLDAPSGHKQRGAAPSLRRATALGIPAYTLDTVPEDIEGHLVIDSPPDAGNESLLPAADLADIILVPSGDSLDDLEVAAAFIEEAVPATKAYILLTRINPHSEAPARRLQEGLRDSGFQVLDSFTTLLEAYKIAASRGTTVVGLPTAMGRRAAREYGEILEEVRQQA